MSRIIEIKDLMYRIHLDKIRRWLKKIKSFYNEQPEIEFDELLDCYEVYCIFCYHLRDYLIESSLFDKAKVDNFIQSNPELKICRDICTRTKHLIVREPMIDSNVAIVGNFVSSNSTSDRPHLYYDWQIEVNNEKRNPLEVATKCLSLWESFIVSCGQIALPVS